MATWWLSFANARQFLGAMIVDAESLADAVRQSHRAHTNPGGDVMGYVVDDPSDLEQPRSEAEQAAIDALPRLQLFSREELTQRGVFTEQVPCQDHEWIQ